MAFQPHVDQVLTIERVPYRIATHPSAPGMAYGQEGRQGTVYQLLAEDGTERALKVFKPRFRVPALVLLAERIASWAALPGLQVCERTVLSAHRHADLLREHPDLIYAVLMPWIAGPTWLQVLLEKRDLPATDCLALARGLASLLAHMEERGLAHCDLSGPNVLLPGLVSSPPAGRRWGGAAPDAGEARSRGLEVALVDVEQLYAPDLRRPSALPGGSPGYAHSTAPDGLWAAEADRFAGAVLLAEMLCWCDERVREAAWGESYFDPAEVQSQGRRYGVLAAVLQERWGGAAAGLFERAWRSDTLSDCATFGEWLLALPERMGVAAVTVPPAAPPPREQAPAPEVEQPQTVAEAGLLAVVHDSEEAELAALFDEGVAACERGEWQRGVELLAEVVRRRPGYAWGGKRAQELLERAQAWAERQDGSEARTPGRAGLAVLFGCCMLALVLLAVAAMGSRQRAQVAATQTAVAVAMVHEASLSRATPRPTMTATASTTPVPSPTPTPLPSSTPVPPTPTVAPTRVPAPPADLSLTLAPGVELELVRVPAGEFTMGSADGLRYHRGDEGPEHTVYVGEYYIGKYEVTVAQFRAFVEATGYRTMAEQKGWAYAWTSEGVQQVQGVDWRQPRQPGSGAADDHPVTQVTWDDAVAFCHWASQVTRRALRLPTEAEWEKAARGIDARPYPWGSEAPDGTRGNYGFQVGDTVPVGSYPAGASPYGALDMAGNVEEWTSSLHMPYPYRASDGQEDARNRDARVVRGGGFYWDPGQVRATERSEILVNACDDKGGFRVCMSP